MPAASIARFVVLEARRSGLPWLVAASVAAGLGLAAFLSQVAVTGSVALQTAIVAALLRACAVFLVALQVVTSTQREHDDKGLELMLSLPLSRPVYYLGRLAGFAACGAVVSTFVALPLLLWSPPQAVFLWALSLCAETALVAAGAMFFSLTLAQLLPAAAATAGLYLLARSIGAIQAIAGGPLAEPSLPQHIARWCVDAVALLLPRLDAVTRADWLIYGTPAPGQFAAAMAGLIVYALLLAAAGLFDFYRRNL